MLTEGQGLAPVSHRVPPALPLDQVGQTDDSHEVIEATLQLPAALLEPLAALSCHRICHADRVNDLQWGAQAESRCALATPGQALRPSGGKEGCRHTQLQQGSPPWARVDDLAAVGKGVHVQAAKRSLVHSQNCTNP